MIGINAHAQALPKLELIGGIQLFSAESRRHNVDAALQFKIDRRSITIEYVSRGNVAKPNARVRT
jgi:hypothetical protein